jgi:hypothetical protein
MTNSDRLCSTITDRLFRSWTIKPKKLYYLISADQFEKVRAQLIEEDFDPREMYPLISKTAAEAGWNDPEMDAYDRYDEHRPKQG